MSMQYRRVIVLSKESTSGYKNYRLIGTIFISLKTCFKKWSGRNKKSNSHNLTIAVLSAANKFFIHMCREGIRQMTVKTIAMF